jgi:hypothetical protein
MPNNFFDKTVMFADANGNFIPFDESTEFFSNWNEYSVMLNTDKGPITLKWKNVQALAANWFMQTGSWMKSPNLQTFFDFFPMWVNYNWWQNNQRNVYELPSGSTIIDIGSGNSVFDLLLHKYIPDSKFYLVDRNNFITAKSNAKYPTRDNPCWLHSWNIVEDAIQSSNIDRSNFTFLDIDDDWNVEADMITSYMAWCMHFPKEEYWSRVLKSLKIGGRLLIDINIGWEQQLIEEISDELNCRHTVITSIPIKPIFNQQISTVQSNRDNLNIAAYRCSWIRNR